VLDEAARNHGYPAPTVKCVDENVWAQTAKAMLPRAVGYSAGLLDYFFRGRLAARVQVTKDATGFTATLRITNLTPNETMDGDFAIYYDAPDGTRTQLAGSSQRLMLAPNTESDALTVRLPSTMPVSPWLLVFSGKLGLEEGAAAATSVRFGYLGFFAYVRTEYSSGFVSEYLPPFFDFSPYVQTPFLGTFKGITRGAGNSPSGPGFWLTTSTGDFVLYRDPDPTLGTTVAVTVKAPPWSWCRGDESLWYPPGNPRFTTLFILPSGAELIELEPPRDLTTLFSYSPLNPPKPTARSPLATLSSTNPGPVFVDVSGVTFLGLRLKTLPQDPGQISPPEPPSSYPERYIAVGCGFGIDLRFP
jgi:hypothetical protein